MLHLLQVTNKALNHRELCPQMYSTPQSLLQPFSLKGARLKAELKKIRYIKINNF